MSVYTWGSDLTVGILIPLYECICLGKKDNASLFISDLFYLCLAFKCGESLAQISILTRLIIRYLENNFCQSSGRVIAHFSSTVKTSHFSKYSTNSAGNLLINGLAHIHVYC